MNRFFSKLDLRDIKIDPEGSRYPPGDDPDEGEESAIADNAVDHTAEDDSAFEDVPAASEVEDDFVDQEQAEQEQVPLAPASQNGHGSAEAVAATYVQEVGDEILKVSARSRPSAVAGAIAGVVREFGRAEVQAIGAGATNQAIKAAAIARDYLLDTDIDVVCVPAFIDVTIDNEDRTAIRLVIEPR